MSPLRQWLGRVGLGFALVVIVSPAVLFFLWMLSLSVKFEVDNASYPPVFIPEHFNWGNYAAVFRSNRFSTYFINSLIVTGTATAFALLVGVPAGYGLARMRAHKAATSIVSGELAAALLGLVCTSAMIPKANYRGAPGDQKSLLRRAPKMRAPRAPSSATHRSHRATSGAARPSS